MLRPLVKLMILMIVTATFSGVAAQELARELNVGKNGTIEITNRSGRVDITAEPGRETAGISAVSPETPVSDREVAISGSGSRMRIEVAPTVRGKRIDLVLKVPERVRVKVTTGEGEIRIAGDIAQAEATTGTGTIAANVPDENIEYDLNWTASRPRVVSDFPLEDVKERSAGRFSVKGKYGGGTENAEPVRLKFTTARGIILVNVPPNEVAPDLRERPLTEAAKAIVRSGDSLLMEAIRRASPKHFGDYAQTLPPFDREPRYAEKGSGTHVPEASIRRVTVRVADQFNRAVTDLKPEDFAVAEGSTAAEIIRVESAESPFNLVLLLDVSGSVENYVTFIRKAARNFVNTVGPNDRVSIIIFNDDVKGLTGFTTDKTLLSESLDTFDAGGGTAYYDAIAYTLSEALRPLKGERTAVVILTDGDDNRSFLAFDTLLGSIQESGALIYPLYVPSALVAASANDLNAEIDPLRSRYMTLTSKAEGEGPKLAEASGGVYYPITRLSQIQTAYDDIVKQLRTAYSITFRSAEPGTNGTKTPPRLRITVKRDNAYVLLGPIVGVD